MAILLPPNASADSYCDVATADAYHATRLDSAEWTAADTATKEAALKMATRRLDEEDWIGLKTDELVDNSLRWPRSQVYNADGQLVPADSVPLAIAHATAEQALDFLKSIDASAAGTTFPTEEVVVGPIKLKLDTSGASESVSEPLSSAVDTLIAPYRKSSVTGALIRG